MPWSRLPEVHSSSPGKRRCSGAAAHLPGHRRCPSRSLPRRARCPHRHEAHAGGRAVTDSHSWSCAHVSVPLATSPPNCRRPTCTPCYARTGSRSPLTARVGDLVADARRALLIAPARAPVQVRSRTCSWQSADAPAGVCGRRRPARERGCAADGDARPERAGPREECAHARFPKRVIIRGGVNETAERRVNACRMTGSRAFAQPRACSGSPGRVRSPWRTWVELDDATLVAVDSASRRASASRTASRLRAPRAAAELHVAVTCRCRAL